jgi:enoyl-CoA hydratase
VAVTLITETEIVCEKRGPIGLVTLSRPKALNALTLGMVRGLAEALDIWERDPEIMTVLVQGAGGKAFCAGGDIRRLHDLGKAGAYDEAQAFWREEYLLNIRIKTYPKPYVSLIDGIVMGGGVGVSLHGSHRVAGPKYLFAMPEVGIGFFPDVGATFALPRLPGAFGAYLAVTGARIGQADALALGLATHAVGEGAIEALRDRLIAGEPLAAALAALSVDPGPSTLLAHADIIEAAFSLGAIESIMAELAARADDAFAAKTLQGLQAKSPTSMKLALAQMRVGGNLTFTEAMRLEYRIVSRVVRGHDFFEGVRAVIIDKDGAPRWSPAETAQVADAAIDAYFAPVADDLPI